MKHCDLGDDNDDPGPPGCRHITDRTPERFLLRRRAEIEMEMEGIQSRRRSSESLK